MGKFLFLKSNLAVLSTIKQLILILNGWETDLELTLIWKVFEANTIKLKGLFNKQATSKK